MEAIGNSGTNLASLKCDGACSSPSYLDERSRAERDSPGSEEIVQIVNETLDDNAAEAVSDEEVQQDTPSEAALFREALSIPMHIPMQKVSAWRVQAEALQVVGHAPTDGADSKDVAAESEGTTPKGVVPLHGRGVAPTGGSASPAATGGASVLPTMFGGSPDASMAGRDEPTLEGEMAGDDLYARRLRDASALHALASRNVDARGPSNTASPRSALADLAKGMPAYVASATSALREVDAKSPGQELLYKFSSWGQEHSVRVVTGGDRMQLHPSTGLVDQRLQASLDDGRSWEERDHREGQDQQRRNQAPGEDEGE